MINRVEALIMGGLEHSGEVELGSLIWTIDAKEHCIVSPEEINAALENIKSYEIIRSNEIVSIFSSENRSSDKISEKDIKKAMKFYENMYLGNK